MGKRKSKEELVLRLYDCCKTVVNGYFGKRKLNKKTFTFEELKNIEELNFFLRSVFLSGNHRAYINVSAKFTVKVRGEMIPVFINKFLDINDFNYKDPLIIAKGLFLLCSDQRAEVYLSVSSFELIKKEADEPNKRGKKYTLRRVKRGCYNVSVLYVDCDLDEEHNRMGDKELIEWVHELCPFLIGINKFIVRTGNGIHIWLLLNQFKINTPVGIEKYETLERKLIKACEPIYGDMVAHDCTRILRCPKSFNRKAKFTKPYPVHIIEEPKGKDRISIGEMDTLLNSFHLISNDNEYPEDDAFVTISSEQFYSEISGQSEPYPIIVSGSSHHKIEKQDNGNEMISLEEFQTFCNGTTNTAIDTNGYDNDDWVNVPDEERASDKHSNAEKKSEPAVKKADNILPHDYVFSEDIIVKNLRIAFKMQRDHRLRDIWFTLLNRRDMNIPSTGHRHRILFQCAYCLYNDRVKDKKALFRELDMVNELFIDPFSEREMSKEKTEIYKTLANKNRRIIKHMKNLTLNSLLCLTDIEKRYSFGNYYDEKKEKDLFRQKNLQKYAIYNVQVCLERNPSMIERDCHQVMYCKVLGKYFEECLCSGNVVSYKDFKSKNDVDITIDQFRKYRKAFDYAQGLKLKIDFPIPDEEDTLEVSRFLIRIFALDKNVSYMSVLYICPYVRRVIYEFNKRFSILVFYQ